MEPDRIARASAAAKELSLALWEAMDEQARAGRTAEVAALSRRLAEICASVADVAGAPAGTDTAEPQGRDAAGLRESWAPADAGGGHASPRDAQGRGGGADADFDAAAGERAARDAPRRGHDGFTPADGGQPARVGGGQPAGHAIPAPQPRIGGMPAALVDEHEQQAPPPQAIAIRDVRNGDGGSWRIAVQRRLERYAEDRVPFALMLVELLDSERMRAALEPAEACRRLQALERAIGEQLRPGDALLREIDGRYWVLAPETGGAAARSLGERLAAAAARSGAHRGAPLKVAVGIAQCPQHGLDAESLIGHADVDLYAAQASGRSVGGFESGEAV